MLCGWRSLELSVAPSGFCRIGLTSAARGTTTIRGIFERVGRLEESSAPAGRKAASDCVFLARADSPGAANCLDGVTRPAGPVLAPPLFGRHLPPWSICLTFITGGQVGHFSCFTTFHHQPLIHPSVTTNRHPLPPTRVDFLSKRQTTISCYTHVFWHLLMTPP